MPLSHRSLRCTLLALVLCATPLLPACAQISTPGPASASAGPTPSSQRRAIAVGQISVSPDGKRLAWVDGGVILFSSFANLGQTQRITAASFARQLLRRVRPSPGRPTPPLSPSSPIAPTSAANPTCISRISMANRPSASPHLHGDVDAPAFSPDGKRIAFLYVEGATRPAGALAAMDAPSGVIGEDGIEVQRVAAVAAVNSIASPAGRACLPHARQPARL